MKRFFILALLLVFLLTGCNDTGETKDSTSVNTNQAVSQIDTSKIFTDRDKEGSYQEGGSAVITLSGSTASCSSNAVTISGSTVTITDEGTYILSGTLDDGMIIVNADKTDKTQLVLNGVTINSQTSAAIYILQADKVFLTLAEGTSNTLSNGGTFTQIDDNNIDAAVFSKEDLTLNGSGTLTVNSPAGHGIVSKDDLVFTGGNYTITTAGHGVTGKDCISMTGATLDIAAGKDGIHAENADDAALGLLYVENGDFTISAEGDGLSATGTLQIDGGTFQITAGGGSVNGSQQSSDAWGGMGGGGRPGSGFMGGGMSSSSSTASSEDSTSMKGIKATGNLLISGGSYIIDSADDAVHADASISISGGSFQIATGDDAFHAEDTLTFTAGEVDITECYEGLEALHINMKGGNIKLVASDDGLNAAGGNDSSGTEGGRDGMFGGRPGGGMGMSSSSNGSIVISGGTLYINSSGDGIDANGTLTISGGYVTVVGPTQGDTATLDYDISATISGGTFIGTGASGMAQTFSDSEQGVIAVSVGSQSAGTQITLTDSSGNTVISYAPELNFAVVILSSPDVVKGQSYTITVGSASGTFAAE